MDTVLFKIPLALIVATSDDEKIKLEECACIILNNKKYWLVPADESEMTEEKIKNKEVVFSFSNAIPPELTEIKEEDVEGEDYIYMQDGDKKIKIVFNDILYIQAVGKMVQIFKTSGYHKITSITLDDYEKHLPPKLFFRIHHGHIVYKPYIVKPVYARRGGFVILIDKTKLDISFNKKSDFKKWFD